MFVGGWSTVVHISTFETFAQAMESGQKYKVIEIVLERITQEFKSFRTGIVTFF